MKNINILIITGIVIVLIGGVFYNIYSKKNEVITIKDICEDVDCSNLPMPLNPPLSNDTTFTPAKPLIETTSSNPVQSGKIDEHLTIDNTLREVNFCGKIYKVKQVFIDGVDVAQRIAELATKNQFIERNLYEKNLGKNMCESIISYMYSQKMNQNNNSNEINIPEVTTYINESQNITYNIYLNSWYFHLNTETSDIYLIGGYDGSLIGPIGKLK